MKLFVIGVGTTSGAPIPTAQGNLLDENGREVHTALNEQMCRQLAKAGSGQYLSLGQTEQVRAALQKGFSQLKQREITTVHSEADEQFPLAVGFALLLLVLETILYETKYSLTKQIKHFFTR